jgi:hypothetical protein
MRVGGALFVIILIHGASQPVAARPHYLAQFQADPMRRAEVDGCVTCHVNPAGGGARNDFGTAFGAANHEITPLLRATFPQNFKFDAAKLPDGTLLFLSDPTSKSFVLDQRGQRTVVDLATLLAPKAPPVPPSETRMGFFVTSQPVATGGRLGGLAGADRVCQDLAKAAGAGDRTWRAYLSTSFQAAPAINAGDRIGPGPWFNAKGMLVARGAADLHAKPQIRRDVLLTEQGEKIATSEGATEDIQILTGTMPNGTAALDKNCDNWTSIDGEALVGDLATSWNSARTASCKEPVQNAAAAPRLYCFAAK